MVRGRPGQAAAWSLTHEAQMKKNITPGWKFVAIVVEGERVVLHGQNVWDSTGLLRLSSPSR